MTTLSSRKQVRKDTIEVTLTISGWVLDLGSGYYKYAINDSKILDGSVIVSSFDNANYEAVKSAEFLQITSVPGVLTFWAIGVPVTDINIKYSII